jgi:hypothetical protein
LKRVTLIYRSAHERSLNAALYWRSSGDASAANNRMTKI